VQVVVVGGGRSLERKFSLLSRHHVGGALRHLGHETTEVDVDPELTKSIGQADLVFIALHGKDGEDGTIQLACEAMGVAYTGSPPLTCRFTFDKGLSKALLRKADLPAPPGFVLTEESVRQMGAGTAVRRAAERVGYPLIVKPAAQGSALGLTLVESPDELSRAVIGALDHGDRVLLETYVEGTEVSVAVVGTELEALPPIEVRTTHAVHDFEARISPGAVEYVAAKLDADVLDRTRAVALEAARLLGIRDFGRVDLRIGSDGPTVLDIKTCPGLTDTSIFSIAVAESGKSFESFIDAVRESAMARSEPART
jgi:D-alanine-D-alanine ligase